MTTGRTLPSSVGSKTSSSQISKKSKGAVVEERRAVKGPEILQEGIPKPPNKEDEYTLEAFGDISLTNINFVPPLPTPLSPRKIALKKPPLQHKTASSLSYRRQLGYAHKIRAPSLSKARIDATEMSFESLLTSLRQTCDPKSVKGPVNKTKSPMPTLDVASPAKKHLADLINLGGEAVISDVWSHDVVPKSKDVRVLVGESNKCTAERDENDVSASSPIPQGKPLRANGKLPKRLPLPLWDVDNETQSDLASRYKLT